MHDIMAIGCWRIPSRRVRMQIVSATVGVIGKGNSLPELLALIRASLWTLTSSPRRTVRLNKTTPISFGRAGGDPIHVVRWMLRIGHTAHLMDGSGTNDRRYRVCSVTREITSRKHSRDYSSEALALSRELKVPEKEPTMKSRGRRHAIGASLSISSRRRGVVTLRTCACFDRRLLRGVGGSDRRRVGFPLLLLACGRSHPCCSRLRAAARHVMYTSRFLLTSIEIGVAWL